MFFLLVIIAFDKVVKSVTRFLVLEKSFEFDLRFCIFGGLKISTVPIR